MSSPCPERGTASRRRGGHAGTAAALLLLALATGCEREERRFREIPPGASGSPLAVLNDQNQPGPMLLDPAVRNAYEENAWAVAEGERLYEQFNCAGCHAPGGGGGMGPALIDSVWRYGSDPENLYASIVEGRPLGMPAFGGRIGNPEVWKLVAYVRSLNSLTPKGTRSGRSEAMSGIGNDPQRETMTPMAERVPPEQRPPARTPPPGGR